MIVNIVCLKAVTQMIVDVPWPIILMVFDGMRATAMQGGGLRYYCLLRDKDSDKKQRS